MKTPRLLVSCVAFSFLSALLSVSAVAQSPDVPESWFQPNAEWTSVGAIALDPADPAQLKPAAEGSSVLYHNGVGTGAPQLRAKTYLSDRVLRFEFMQPAGGRAGLYLHGRYRIELAAEEMGALAAAAGRRAESLPQPRVPPQTEGAAGAPGAWQTFEARFRAPRMDEARNKTAHALIMEVTINGKRVQTNTVAKHWSRDSEFGWEDFGGHTTLRVDQGSFALRNYSELRADFEAVKVPETSGAATNVAELVDFVRQGEQTFRSLGCVECHAVQEGDTSQKTGPNLFGLFRLEPRDRVIATADERRFTLKANRVYLHRSVRAPNEELAIAEDGPSRGKPYLPVMPPYAPTVLSDPQIDAIGSYLATLNDFPEQGPVVHLVEKTGPKHVDPLEDRTQLLVSGSVRIQRGPMSGLSGRTIHVGQPSGLHYSFDPRVLGVARIWQGGFLDMSGEWLNRGGRGLNMGYESREIDLAPSGVLLAPLNRAGNPVDLSFKQARFGDSATVSEVLNSPRDHPIAWRKRMRNSSAIAAIRVSRRRHQLFDTGSDATPSNCKPIFFPMGESA